MPWDGKLSNWFRTGEQQRIVYGYNTHEAHLHNRRQYGGTFIMVFGPSSDRVVETGVDPSGLGRWCWVRFSSKTGRSISFYIVYRPVRQTRDHALSTYMQHSRYLESTNDYTCPRKALLRDLQAEINSRVAIGDSLVIAGDFNDDVSKGHLHDFFQDTLGFREATMNRHTHQPPPSTMARGTLPVDAVWLSPDLPVLAASWLSFPESPGDHRASVIDFDIDEILGEPAQRVFRPQGRRLNTKLPGVRSRYLKLLEQQFTNHRIIPKLYGLRSQSWNSRWHQFAQQVEQLDRLRVDALRHAEKHCRRFHSGATFFSPELDKWYKLRRLYSMVLHPPTERRGPRRATIIKLAKKCSVDRIFTIPPHEVRRRYREADLQYRTLKPRSAELRDTFLRHRLTESPYGSTTHKAIAMMIMHENQRAIARHLRVLEGVPVRKSVTSVQVETSPGVLQDFGTQLEVEEALRQCFENRFRLTDTSPLMQSPIFDLLGNGTNTPASQQILAGTTHSLPQTSLYTTWFLAGLARPDPPLPTISTEITRQDFQRYWRRAKERTASSISGLHFGHYKAAAENETISEVHSLLTEMLFRTGYPLRRWQSGLQIILEKKPGVTLVQKLRAILLMEADFNFGNKLLIGSRMTHGAHNHNAIPSELYGGVKGRRVEYMSLGRRLFADILRQKRCTGAVASVDAQACYDRITHSTASLCCQRWGVPPRPMETMLHTIQAMKFFLRTGYGDSDHYYGGGSTRFQGVCQGNGARPAIWLAISTVLVNILKEKTPGNPIRGALSMVGLIILAMIFVDDTDLLLFDPPDSGNTSSILPRLQALIHLWQGLLQASGGSLSADKCSWCLVAFRWHAGTWSYHTSTTLPGNMYVKDTGGLNMIPINRIEPTRAITVVGVEQSMDGSMRHQLEVLTDVTKRWGNALAKRPLPRHIGWAAIRSKIWPSLRFPLSATTISQSQGRHLMKHLYRSLLPSLGANRNLPASVRYGPPEVAGLDLPEPYVYQGSQQIALFYQLFGTQTNEGHLLRVSLEHLQLEVGMGIPVLSLDYSQYGFLATPSWLTSLWQFLSHYKIKLDIQDFSPPRLCRSGDDYIMANIMSCTELSRAEKLSANRCRLYLQSVVWSDLSTGSGTDIRDLYYHVRRDPSVISHYEWPVEHPSRRDMSNWQRSLTLVLGNKPLNLGIWISDPHYVSVWWYDPAADLIYKSLMGKWLEYGKSFTRSTRLVTTLGSRYKLQGVQSWEHCPPHLVRTTVREYRGGRISHEGFPSATIHLPSDQSPLPSPVPGTTTLAQVIATWDPKYRGNLTSATFCQQGLAIAQAIIDGSAHGACDGSYMPSRSKTIGACAWILEDSRHPGHNLCHGSAYTPGWCVADVNAYRSELYGIYIILLALRAISHLHHITSGSIQIFCDNKKAVELVSKRVTVVSSLSMHVDLLKSIYWLLSDLPFLVSVQHIRGHQDNLTPFACLPRSSQLNTLCDKAAKQAVLNALAINPSHLHQESLWGELVTCTIGRVKITGDLQRRVANWCTLRDTTDYLVSKQAIPGDFVDSISWMGLGLFLRSQSASFRLWAAKHSYHFAATGRNMIRWGLAKTGACPCCGIPEETSIHLYDCPDSRMAESRVAAIDAFQNWMKSVSTHPDIITCFSSGLLSATPLSNHASTHILAAATDQDRLGRWNTLVGRLNSTWELIQEEYYLSNSSLASKSLSSWSAGMAGHLLLIGHCCWNTRNQILHDPKLGGLSLHEARQLDRDIESQFELGLQHLLRACDVHLLRRRSQQTILRLPTTQKRIWLHSLALARDQGRVATRAEHNSMAAIMQRWLDSGRPHPP